MPRSIFRPLLTALLAISLLASCGGDGSSGGGDGRSDNILRRGTASEPPSLDPQIALGNSASSIIDDMFVGLMTTDELGETVLGVAESYDVSSDGKVYTFVLKSGLKWSDGTPMGAADFVWSFQRLLSPNTGARYAANLYVVENGRAVNRGEADPDALGVKALDDQTLQITLTRRVPYFLRILTSNATVPLPRHVIDTHGRGWTKPENFVSNGPFYLTQWVPNTRIDMMKNPYFYAADSVVLDGVSYYPTDNTGALVRRFQTGELDIILNFPPEQTAFLKEEFGDQVHIVTNYGLYYYIFNTKKPPFNDPEIRKALSYGVNKEGMAEQILRGEVEAAWSLVPSDISDYSRVGPPEAALGYEARKAAAKDILKGKGITPDSPLNLTIRYDTKEESRQIAVALGSMWKELGVNATLTASDFRGITGDARSGRFDVIRYQWFAPYDDPSSFLRLVGGRSSTNLSGYKNAEYDRLIRTADDVTDMAARMTQLAKAERMVMDDYPVLPIYFTTARRLVSKDVLGWSDFPGGNVQSRYLSFKAAQAPQPGS